MVKRTRWVILAAALVLSSCQTHFVGGWLPWFQTAKSRSDELATIKAAGILFNEVSLFWYGARADGSIGVNGSPTALDPTAAAVHALGLLVIPTIADGTGPGVMRAILLDPTQRLNHEQQIVALVQSKGYDGIDLDYEVFAFGDHMSIADTGYVDAWVAFVTDISAMLHANGKLLSVTIPTVWQDQTTQGVVTRGSTFYAQSKIAAPVDRLRLMAYDFHVGSPGSIAPMSWVTKVMTYSTGVAGVPASKLELGVPAYGRHWAVQKNPNEVCPDGAVHRASLTMKAAPAFLSSRGLTAARDSSGELTATWDQIVTGPRTTPIPPPIIPVVGSPASNINSASDANNLQPAQRLAPPSTFVTCTVHNVVYYPDAASVKQRADAAMAAGWHGIFIWALGYETTDTYQQLANVGP